MWPRIVADPSTLGRHVCYVCKRSVCGGDEPQPVAHLSHKLQCARQSLKIMVSYGNKYPRHKARPHVAEQSGQCARALTHMDLILTTFAGDDEGACVRCVEVWWRHFLVHHTWTSFRPRAATVRVSHGTTTIINKYLFILIKFLINFLFILINKIIKNNIFLLLLRE